MFSQVFLYVIDVTQAQDPKQLFAKENIKEHHKGGIKEKASWRRRIREKASWRRHHGGGIVEEASQRRHRGGGIMEEGGNMEEAPWMHLGDIWKDLEGIHLTSSSPEVPGRLLESSGAVWGLSDDLGCLGGLGS